MLDPDKVEDREPRLRIGLDQQIDVAVNALVATRPGTEQGDMSDAFGAQWPFQLSQKMNDLIALHGP